MMRRDPLRKENFMSDSVDSMRGFIAKRGFLPIVIRPRRMFGAIFYPMGQAKPEDGLHSFYQ